LAKARFQANLIFNFAWSAPFCVPSSHLEHCMSETIEKAEAHRLIFTRYMAKGGVILPDVIARQVPAGEAHKLRAKVRDAMSEITKRSDREGRELSDEEMIVFTQAADYIAGLSSGIDLHESARAHFGANHNSGNWVDRETGRPLTVLASTDKLTDHCRSDNGFSKVSFGDIVRSMALGGGGPEIRNALAEGTDSAGGVTVPSFLLPQLVDRMRAQQTVIKAGARTVMLDTLKTTIARLDSDPVAAWRNENASIANSDAVFSPVVLQARSLAVIVQVSMELLEDSINLNEAMQQAFTSSFAVELDRVALFGSGTLPEPRGIFNTAGIGSVSMGTNGLALTNFDPLIDAWQSLKDVNAPDPTAAILAPRTAAKIAKLKDLQNQPLRKPQLIEGLPIFSSTSVPINQTQGSSSVASSIIMGDFSQLLIGVRTELRIQLLRELYAANGQYAFLCYLRADIGVEHPAAFCRVTGVL
jgi:HK97 family phage major capsid protein